MVALSSLWNSIQSWLFPALEEELGDLSEKQKEFIRVCELCELEKHMAPYRWKNNGRPLKDRLAIVKSFVAKAVYNLPTTTALIEYVKSSPTLRRLCGWESLSDVPCESTFSRAFSAFAQGELADQIHEAMIKENYQNKLVGHLSRDSSAIKGREKGVNKPKEKRANRPKRKRGRPKKGEERPEEKMTKVQQQIHRSLDENLADLPTDCDWGCKRNSKGKKESWRGFKFHLDVADGDVPISPLLTSASVFDNQAAIPLAQMSSERVTNLYDLMDAAYDTKEIKQFSTNLGHVPLIDHNPRRGEKVKMPPAEKVRYHERSSAERVFSNLENYGIRNVRVRGAKKVMAHLMFGVLALTANQLFNMIT